MKNMIPAGILIFILLCGAGGCNNRDTALSFQGIPHYPASVPEQGLDGAVPSGVIKGELVQLSTTDPFDTVVEFYTGELSRYNPEVLSHSSGLGRQTAITIQQDSKVFAITIQEFGKENRVAITHMGMEKPE